LLLAAAAARTLRRVLVVTAAVLVLEVPRQEVADVSLLLVA
jgi:hypothetical protein